MMNILLVGDPHKMIPPFSNFQGRGGLEIFPGGGGGVGERVVKKS